MVDFTDKVNPKDSWDWPFILYTGMNWLGYTEPEVWQLTPRKWDTLVSMHVELERKKWGISSDQSQQVTGYIDQIGL